MKVGDCIKKKLTILLVALLIAIPSINAENKKVYLGGESIGIVVNIDGVLVSGLYQINNVSPGAKAGLRPGDIITHIDNKPVKSVKDLVESTKSTKSINVKYHRKEQNFNTNLILEPSEDGSYKTGLLVKDKISGIGTLTFIDPDTKKFSALGHEIIDQGSMNIIYSKDGNIYPSSVKSIIPSQNGKPGGKSAQINREKRIGKINKVNQLGVFGNYYNPSRKKLIEIETYERVKIGEAEIVTVLNGNEEKFYSINIIKLYDPLKRENKQIVFEITDQEILSKSNGIVQGMSGSPIVQNGKLIGCVTHVMVNDVTKGYGVYVETLIEEMN